MSQIIKKKILHIVDDEKFIDIVIILHRLFPGEFEHEYIHIDTNKKELFYIKNQNLIKRYSENQLKKYISKTNPSAIIIHCLSASPIKWINSLPEKIKLIWLGWGVDMYEYPRKNPLIKINLYHDETRKILKSLNATGEEKFLIKFINAVKNKTFIKSLKDKINFKYTLYKKFGFNEEQNYLNAVKRVDYFSGVLPSEFDLIKINKNFNAKQVFYSYHLPTPYAANPNFFKGKNIIIGNSANPTNNHADIIKILKKIDLGNREIYMPLSYGGYKKYINKIIELGIENFEKNFKPLLEFMDKEAYSKILEKCEIGIFMNERQQGLGNVVTLLMGGAKVFLSETSVHYKYYKSLGLKIFSVQSDLNKIEINTPLREKDKWNNYNILSQRFTNDKFEEKLNSIYRAINAD